MQSDDIFYRHCSILLRFCLFYIHMAIWSFLMPIGIFYAHLVYYIVIWYIKWPFSIIFVVVWYILWHFGLL
jgi:hypothetical protein